jgi:glycerol transport system ATP-binding protein
MDAPEGAKRLEIGVRPEFIRFDSAGLPVDIVKVDDVGRFRIVEVSHKSHVIKLVTPENVPIPDDKAHLAFDPDKTHVYADGWVIN